MKVSGKIVLFILILSGVSAPRGWGTVYHSNGTAANVQSIHNILAQNGDTITLPAGTFTWTTQVRITKAITLQGQGIGRTIVRDNVQNPNRDILWTLAPGLPSRMTGIEFRDGGRSPGSSEPQGCIYFGGDNQSGATLRVDHCKFNDINGQICTDTVIGVFDHDDFVLRNPGVAMRDGNWNGDAFGKGDASYAAPSNFGSGQFLFFEDCTASLSARVGHDARGLTDAVAGARFVVRHCTLNNVTIQTHGTESTGRPRSVRAVEVYNNTFNYTFQAQSGIRGGVILLHDNLYNGPGATSFNLACFRMSSGDAPWNAADGTNFWDINNPIRYDNGTVKSSGNLTLTDTTKLWRPNQWVGYTVRKLGVIGYSGSEIISNTRNRITFADGHDSSLSFSPGNHFEIRKVNQALDSCGRAGGSVITGAPLPVRPLGWNNQVTEPCYSWNNVRVSLASIASVIRYGEHYFNNTPMPGYTPYTYPHPLVTGAARAVLADLNRDGHPDYLLFSPSTPQTVVWYMNNNVHVTGAAGPTLPAGWSVVGSADFNRDSNPDYLLFNPSTLRTVIWYMNNNVHVSGAYGPTLPAGWEVVATADFNGNGYPDYVLYNTITRQTAIWYLGGLGPTLPPGWSLIGVADFNGDGHPDYALFNSSNGQTAIWYLSGRTLIYIAYGPTVPIGWALVATADFNGDSKPDYLLYNVSTRQTAIWYLNNNVFVGSAFGPTVPPGWSLIAP